MRRTVPQFRPMHSDSMVQQFDLKRYTLVSISMGGRTPFRGVYVKISAKLESATKMNSVHMVQFVREYVPSTGKSLDLATIYGAAGKKLLNFVQAPNGWRVDSDILGGGKAKDLTPYYTDGETGMAGRGNGPAIIWDAPAFPLASRDVGKEFYTVFVGLTPTNTLRSLGAVYWNFEINAAGAVSFQAKEAQIGIHPLLPAVDKWNSNKEIIQKLDVNGWNWWSPGDPPRKLEVLWRKGFAA